MRPTKPSGQRNCLLLSILLPTEVLHKFKLYISQVFHCTSLHFVKLRGLFYRSCINSSPVGHVAFTEVGNWNVRSFVSLTAWCSIHISKKLVKGPNTWRMDTHTHTHKHTHTERQTHTQTHIHIHTLTHTYIHTAGHTHTHIHTPIHTHTHTETHTHTHTDTHTDRHTHIYIHTAGHTQTHTHTHIHTHTHRSHKWFPVY